MIPSRKAMPQALLDSPRTAPLKPARFPVSAEIWLRRLVVLVLGGWLAVYIFYTFLASNFHAVLPGEVYRSAQPSANDIRRLAKRYGVRTVLNLRGLCIGHPWYVAQCKAVQELGIAQEDLTFSAHRLPSSGELRRLIEVLDQAEKPVLLHCRQGADRTGLAAVVVRFLYTDDTLEEALGHMGWRYGHLPIGKTLYMDRFFDLYTNWLKAEGKEHSAAVFRHWACNAYRGGWCQHAIESFEPLQSVCKRGEPLGFRVRLKNISPRPWTFRPHETAGMHLGVEVFDAKNLLVELVRAGKFQRDVAPGEAIELIVAVPPLDEAGKYRLRLDMIDEGQCWFQQAGAEPWEEEIVVHE